MDADEPKQKSLSRFLRRNTVSAVETLPYVHTTRSYNIASIKDTQSIDAKRCRHFNEDLIYLFVGRPAYKRPSAGSAAEYWELPCCFIFDEVADFLVKRVYPFDSGAFRDGRYPEYIDFMDFREFEVDDAGAPGRMVSAFFGDSARYFRGTPKGKEDFENEFQLGVLEAEIKALRRLAEDGTPAGFDDRRFTIEVQVADKIDFRTNPPAAVVLPSIYLRDEAVRAKIIDEWGAEPLTYEMYGLSQDKYDGIIYAKVEEYYRSRGLV
jgi:hypothetical protein